MSKKDDILKKEVTEYELTEEEKLQVASLIALIEQARQAQDILYSTIVKNIGDRYEITDKDLTLNFEEMMKDGVQNAKLVVS
jgi:hypothetical protein